MTPDIMIEGQRPILGIGLQDLQLTPNNSLQRTYLPVTSFAYVKEPPATVGR